MKSPQEKTNNNKTLEDLIGREDFIEKILQLIEYSDSSKNWCFAIDGEWGCGKTFVLNMLEENLINRENVVLIKRLFCL